VVDEYGEIQPNGLIAFDAAGRYSFVVSLEARRTGQDLDGRHYEVIVSAVDKAGNPASQSAIIIVPHDQGK